MKYVFSRFVAVGLILSGISCVAIVGVETIEIVKVQVVKSLSGIVHDSNGAPIAGATVSEISADGKT